VSQFRIRDFRPLRKNSLLGFAKVELPSGMVIADVTILSGLNGPWASPPSKPMVGSDGIALKDANGKLRYMPIIEFTSKEIRNRFSTSVIEALRVAHPEALASDDGVA
jgi:DNA-binding cell septation regulator SpoVG